MNQYLERLGSNTNLLKQSVGWRLDHLLDVEVPEETKQQWIDEIREILEEIIRRK